MVKGCGGLARSEFQSDCKRTKKKESFVSFVKFVFFNVVGKKNSFRVFRYFRCFAIKNPPRAAWAFSSFSFVSVPCGRPENIFRIFRDFRCFHNQESAPRSWGVFRVFLSQSDCKRTKKKKSFVSFVKFVFLNVVDKKLIFAYFVIFDVFTIKNPPRVAGAFFEFFISIRL